MFDNEGITHALWVTVQVTIGATILPILVAALAAYALAWIEFPGRDWLFLLVVGLLLVPIQMALIPIFRLYNTLQPLRHDPGPDPLPLRLRAAVRDLPPPQLLRRHPQGPDGGGADRRRLGVGPVLQGRAPARDPRDRLARDLPGALRLERPARRARARPAEPADRAGNRRRSCASSARTSTCSRRPRSSRRSSR